MSQDNPTVQSPTLAEYDTASERASASEQNIESDAGFTTAPELPRESAAGITAAAEQIKKSNSGKTTTAEHTEVIAEIDQDHETQTTIHSKFIISESSKHGRVTGIVLQQASDQAMEIINKVKKTFNEKNHY